MARASQNQFSGPVTVFHERRLPEAATPAGYAALIDAYRLAVPVPARLSAIGTRHRLTEQQGWRVFGPRYAPDATLEGHLTFALKHEGLDLAVLKRLFLAVGPASVEALGFIGEHDRDTRMPLLDHISARPEDLPSLINGMATFDRTVAEHLDPVIGAAMFAFGFVFVHPFEDGNGRLHRYLIHHVLARRGFNPPGLVFPVSSAILSGIDAYRSVLEAYSTRVLPVVQWAPTQQGNVRVLNDTGDFYRFFDATPQAEFLFDCVSKTIEEDLPAETDYLRRYDEFRRGVEGIVDMPGRTIDLLFRMLQQNNGRLSQRARQREFQKLTHEEAEGVEAIYGEVFPADGAPS